MKNWKLSPSHPQVAQYVKDYWFLKKEASDLNSDYDKNHPKLNPHPAAHLILSDAEHVFRYEQGASVQTGRGSHWIYPHRKTFTMEHTDTFQILGIKFHIGALYALKKMLPNTPLDVIDPADLNQLTLGDPAVIEQLLSTASQQPEQVRERLDQLLVPWLAGSQTDKHSELVTQILPLLGRMPMAQMGDALNRSQRTIERSFLRVTDLTLKQCHSMIRLEALLEDLYQQHGDEINWGDLAAKFEFSDQPHLIRHLKSTLGKTPGQYARQRDLTIDVYGNFENG
jgi:AraC-like DNA-binding protein